MSDLRPWHDCPACPDCGATCAIPLREAHRAGERDQTHTLACPACAADWIGTPEDVAQAERASAAWAEHKREMDRAAAVLFADRLMFGVEVTAVGIDGSVERIDPSEATFDPATGCYVVRGVEVKP